MPQKFEGNNPNLVSILEGFVVSIPATVVLKAKLKLGHRYDIHFMLSRPFTLLFKENSNGNYTLSPQGKSGGAKFTLRRFYTEVLFGRVDLPLFNLKPIYMDHWDYDMGLIVEDYVWATISARTNSAKDLSDNEYGVYLCLDAAGRILRIGEGMLKQRMQAHLREQWVDVVEFNYFIITDENSSSKKEDGMLYEKMLIQSYQADFGELPKYNKILR